MGQLVAEHRFDFGVVEPVQQAGGDGDGILLSFMPVAKALSASLSITLSFGMVMPREMHRFSRMIVEPRLFRARHLAAAGDRIDHALMEVIGDDDPECRAQRRQRRRAD